MLKISAAAILAFASLFSSTAGAVNYTTYIGAPTALHPGDSITSANQKYFLTQQHDGNLVLYRSADRKALWASFKVGAYAMIQWDGNFVQYAANGQAVWSSGIQNHIGGWSLRVEDDSSVTVIASPFTVPRVIIPAYQEPPPPGAGPCPEGKPLLLYWACTMEVPRQTRTIQACTQQEAAIIANRNNWQLGACF